MYLIPSFYELDKIYGNQNLSMAEFAQVLNINVITARKWLRYRGIKVCHKKKTPVACSKEQLTQMYCNQQQSSRQIGKYYHVDHQTVLKWLRSYNIPRDHKIKRKTTFSKDELYNLYHTQHLSQQKIAKIYRVSQVIIGQWMIKWDIPRRTFTELTKGTNNPFYGKKHKKETIEQHRQYMLYKNLNGENNPFYGKHHSEETLKKIMESRQVKPNRAELKLNSIIQHLSTNYEYNGDFRRGIAIGGKIPDWVNVNGEKKLIELLGHGWHIQNQWFKVPLSKTEDYIINHYKKYGWGCLTISDYELKNETLLGDKINKFIGAN